MAEITRGGESRFFRYVWRFNALAIATASIGFILLGSYAAVLILKDETRTRRVTNVVNVDEEEKIAEEFSLGRPDVIAGTSYVRVPLRRQQTYGSGSYYSGSLSPKHTDQIVNFLFLNASTSESRWLFERAGQLILESQMLFSKLKSAPEELRQSVGILYVVVDKDSNGDGRLTERDAQCVATSDVDGGNYRKLIEGIEQLYSVQQIADDKVLVLYQKSAQTISELYSLPSMRPLSKTNIPKVGLH
jgi:hypothetical protein